MYIVYTTNLIGETHFSFCFLVQLYSQQIQKLWLNRNSGVMVLRACDVRAERSASIKFEKWTSDAAFYGLGQHVISWPIHIMMTIALYGHCMGTDFAYVVTFQLRKMRNSRSIGAMHSSNGNSAIKFRVFDANDNLWFNQSAALIMHVQGRCHL